MELTIATIKAMESLRYPQIADYYAGLPEDLCELCCAWEDPGRTELLGAMAAVPLASDSAVAAIRFLWLRDEIGRGEVLIRILLRLGQGLKNRGISRILYWHMIFDGEEDGAMTDKTLKLLGFRPEERRFFSCGYYLGDIYDTPFMQSSITLSVKDTLVKRFSEYSRNKSRLLISKLERAAREPFYGCSLESPYSRFCMNGNVPLGAMTMEMPDPDTVVIGGVRLSNNKQKKLVFAALLAGVFREALETHGLDTRVIGRFQTEDERDLFERLLGLSEIPVEYQPYYFSIR